MKSSDQYKPTQSFGLIIVGAPGTGKTCLAAKFPRPYYLDCDNNLNSVRSVFPSSKFLYDTIDVDDNGAQVAEEKRWVRLLDCTTTAAKSPDVETIILDSLTKASDYLVSFILDKEKPKDGTMRIQDWGTFKVLMTRYLTKLRTTGKMIVVIAHEKYDKDEMSGVLQFKVTVPGQLGDHIGALFTDMWRCECKEAKPGEYSYFVRTKPTARISLKTSMPIAPTFEFSWETVKKYLQPV